MCGRLRRWRTWHFQHDHFPDLPWTASPASPSFFSPPLLTPCHPPLSRLQRSTKYYPYSSRLLHIFDQPYSLSKDTFMAPDRFDIDGQSCSVRRLTEYHSTTAPSLCNSTPALNPFSPSSEGRAPDRQFLPLQKRYIVITALTLPFVALTLAHSEHPLGHTNDSDPSEACQFVVIALIKDNTN